MMFGYANTQELTMKISNSYPLLELSTLAGLPYGVLLTASDCCCCGEHNGHCNTACDIIHERYSKRQVVTLMVVLQQIHERSYEFPDGVLQVLKNANGDDDLVSFLDTIEPPPPTSDIFIIDFGV